MPGKHTKLFKRIFHGDFRPADGMDYSRAYKRWMKENYEAHQRFRKTLKKGQLEAFGELEEMDIELSGRAQEENYIAGMKALWDGTRLKILAKGREKQQQSWLWKHR